MEIQQFLNENKIELWDKLIEHELLNMDDVENGHITIDDLDCDQIGYYEGDENGLIKTDEICGVMEGMDLSFIEKYVRLEDDYNGVDEFEIEINGRKIYGLSYNV